MSDSHKTEHIGDMYILGAGLLWSFFPILVLLSGKYVSPLFVTAVSTFFAFIFFVIVITIQKRWHELLIKEAWLYVLATSLIMGVGYYIFLFWGTSLTTAGNAGILNLMEIFFAFIILGLVWKKEEITARRIYGAILMAGGAFLVKFSGSWQTNAGDWLIVLSTAIPPIGNYFTQQARKLVSSSTLMLARSIVSFIVILILALLFEPIPSVQDLLEVWPYLIVNGFLLLGLSKIFWIEGIHRIPVTKAVTLNTVIPFFTLIWAYLILAENPNWFQLFALFPMVGGALLVINRKQTKVK